MKKNIFWILLIILFSMPTVIALFHPGFFQSDDGEWMIIRFSAFHQALRDGQFPVRFLGRLNYGYGYPVANFLYPGFMYLGEIIKLFGFGFVSTIKILLGISMIGSAIFSFLWFSKLFNKWASFVGSLVYLYAPYHLFDLYTRGSVGEVLALCLMPFVLWQIERRSFLWTSLGAGLLILSHNSLSLLFLFFILIYLLSRGLSYAIYFLVAIMFGLGLSSFFWIPAIFDLKYTIFNTIQISDWSNYFAPLNLVGIIPIFGFVWYFFKLRSDNNRTSKLMFFGGIVFLFLSLSLSSFVWKILPVSLIQFPFRFLSIVILQTSFLVAFLLNKIKDNKAFLLGGMFILISFFSALAYLTPQVFLNKGDMYYSTNEDTTTVKKEYMPIWVSNVPKNHYQKKVEIINGKISDLEIKSNDINFIASSAINTKITINTVYFPGWKVLVDGKNANLNYIDNGLINVNMSSGTHSIRVSFGETPIRLLGDIISLFSFSALSFIVISLRKNFVF